MNALACSLVALLAAGPSAKSAAYKAAFTRWAEGNDEAALAATEKALDAWKAESPNDVEVWIACSNLRANQAARNEADEARRLDEAIACLKKGLAVAPARLDVHFGVLAVYRIGKRWPEIETAASALLTAARAHENELTWRDGKPLPKPANEFVPENVLGYALDDQAPEDVATRMVAAVTDAYPKCGECWNTRGGFLLRREEATAAQLEEGLGYLKRSAALLPSDLMVRTNLGINQLRAGHEADGLKTLEAVLRENPDERQRTRAAQAAGPIWAKASPLKFHTAKLPPPAVPFTAPDGGPDLGTLGGWVAQALHLMGEGAAPKVVANAWCEAAGEPPPKVTTAAKLKASCAEWTKFAEKVEQGAQADLGKLKTLVAAPKTTCLQSRAAIFNWLESWPEAPDALSEEVFGLYLQMKPCD